MSNVADYKAATSLSSFGDSENSKWVLLERVWLNGAERGPSGTAEEGRGADKAKGADILPISRKHCLDNTLFRFIYFAMERYSIVWCAVKTGWPQPRHFLWNWQLFYGVNIMAQLTICWRNYVIFSERNLQEPARCHSKNRRKNGNVFDK